MTRPDRDVMLCRDCCCGDTGKHPSTDHRAQQEVLQACAGPTADGERVRVRVVDCLGQCDRSNVVLVRDFTRGRRPVDTWLGDLHDAATTDRVAGWIGSGGVLPGDLAGHRFDPFVPAHAAGRGGRRDLGPAW